MKRRFDSRPLAVARAELLAAAPPLAALQRVPVEEALGRVTATAVAARRSVPHYLGAAMDGIAVRAADLAGAAAEHPIDLALGEPADTARPFAYVDTGNALPTWADAVVMIERVFAGPGGGVAGDAAVPVRSAADARLPATVHVRAAPAAGQHVRMIGEDVGATDTVVPRGHRLRPFDLGALLAAGVTEIDVRPRPVVAILPTGDELVEPGDEARPGRIVESNSRMVAAFVREWGGHPVRLAPAGDDVRGLAARIAAARADADVVCLIAGSSAGRRDFTVDALASLGRILAHGIDVVPGRPAVVAALAGPGRAQVALGLPGYPVSAAVVCWELLAPLVAHLLGAAPVGRSTVRAVLAQAVASRAGNEELVRVNVGRVAGRLVAVPLARGAGALTTVVKADGLVRVPAECAEIAAREEVAVELLGAPDAVLETVLVCGEHDPCVVALEDALRSIRPAGRLATRWTTPRDAWLALEEGAAHAALLAAAAGAAAGRGAGIPVRRFRVADREIGLLVPRGNPLGLRTWSDLRSRRLCTVAGAAGIGVAPAVRREVSTQTAVAIDVATGLVDAGLAGRAAAAAFALDFVPLGREEYELVLREDFAATAPGRALVEALRSAPFRAALAARPGYAGERSGDERPVDSAAR